MLSQSSESPEWTSHAPERQLWCAVIGRGVQDATDRAGPSPGTPQRQRIRDEAQRWFSRNGEDFRFACEMAGYDPDYVRRRVLGLIDAALQPIAALRVAVAEAV